MSQEHLTHGLTVKFPPSLHAELSAVSEREGVSCGHIIRRALRAELDGVETHRLDPYTSLPDDEVQAQLHEAIGALGNAEAIQDLINAIGDEVVDVLDAGFQTLDVIHADVAHQRLERASGYLQQASDHLLRAAYRVKALRVHEAIASGEFGRIQARLSAEGQPEGRA